MRSECFCNISKDLGFSCEPTIKENIRFRFVKRDNCITDRINLDGEEFCSGLTPNDIAHCELKPRVVFKDKLGTHNEKNNYCDKGGHLERTLANDHRKNGHKEHQKKKNKRY
jgi:hypothetical protein